MKKLVAMALSLTLAVSMLSLIHICGLRIYRHRGPFSGYGTSKRPEASGGCGGNRQNPQDM